MDEKSVVFTSDDSISRVSLRERPAEERLRAEELIKPKFDAELYASEYRDVRGDSDFLLGHFCQCGWVEGRNPNNDFDTVAYLIMNPDVAENGMNPFLHYILYGEGESRTVMPAAFPRQIAEKVLGHDPGDWVTLMRPFVDEAYYTASLTPSFDGSFDPVAHFAYRGWLAGYNPNPHFDVNAALSVNPELRELRLNPFLPKVIILQSPTEQSAIFLENVNKDHAAQSMEARDVSANLEVAKHLDAIYYVTMYPEAVGEPSDAVSHYCTSGWREGKNPIYWFDTNYYLATNKDVAAQGLNPFWHYLVAGMSEGRHPRPPAGYRRLIIDEARSPDEVTDTYVVPPGQALSSRLLETRLRAKAKTRAGLALSFSHDRYTTVTGGIQIFIADEQGQFAGRNIQYLNISPARPLLRLAHPDEINLMVNLTLDGHFIGVVTYQILIHVLKRIPPRLTEQRLFLVHSLFGHAVRELIALHDAVCSKADFFWLHDYSSLCAGYALLRNDVAFCHAPPPESLVCRVCVYGEHRPSHLSMVNMLFETIPFQVIAPSQAALRVWQEHTCLPHNSAHVHPHCELVFAEEPPSLVSEPDMIRVAFIGYPRAHKGWPLWQEIVSRSWQRGVYQFTHFGTAETIHRSVNIKHRIVSTSAEHPDAMIKALADHEIDLVLILSTWPETFSYVTYEALAAGCDIVCLADSGNVADMVRLYSRGVVVNNDVELFAFFESEQAMDYVARSRAKGRRPARVIRNGTTATLLDAAGTT